MEQFIRYQSTNVLVLVRLLLWLQVIYLHCLGAPSTFVPVGDTTSRTQGSITTS